MRRIAVYVLMVGAAALSAGCSRSHPPILASPTPVQFTGSGPSATYIVVHWGQSADPDFASYEVHALPDSSAPLSSQTLLTIIADRATTEFRHQPLLPLTTHVYRVRLVVKDGRHADSYAVSTQTLNNECLAPTAIVAYEPTDWTAEAASLKWSPSCDANFSKYTIYVDSVENFTPGPANKAGEVPYCSDTTFRAVNLAPATRYFFKVVVSNFCDKVSSTDYSTFRTRAGGGIIPPPDPPQIYNFERSDVTGTTVRVRWQPAVEGSWESYHLYYSRQDGFGPTPANEIYVSHLKSDTSYTVTGLRPATNYYFLVLSSDTSGLSSRVPANASVVTSPPLDPVYRFGGYGTPAGNFISPQGAALDAQHRLLIANTGNNRVDVFADPLADVPDTSRVMRIPDAGDGSFTLNAPVAVALDDSGNIYIAEQGRKRVVRTSPTGAFQFAFGGPGAALNNFESLAGIAVDKNHNVWVVDQGRNRIVKFTATGQYVSESRQAFSGFLSQPTGIAYDRTTDRLLVVDSGNQRVAHFTLDGIGAEGDLGIFGVAGSDSGVYSQPSGVAVDAEGTVYVADTGNERVQVYVGGAVRPQGIFRTTITPAQFEDFPFNLFRLSRPKAVAAIPGRMLVVDTGASRCVVAFVTLGSFQSGQAPGARHRGVALHPAQRAIRR